MALTKERKTELVDEYRELIEKSQGMILVEYRGINMKGMDPMRRKVLVELGRPAPEELFAQTTAVAFAFGDAPAVAKALTAVAKDSEFVKVKGGFLGNEVLNAKQVEALADLPPLPVLRAQLLGMISTPATRIAGALASSVRQVASVVKAYSEKDAAPAAA